MVGFSLRSHAREYVCVCVQLAKTARPSGHIRTREAFTNLGRNQAHFTFATRHSEDRRGIGAGAPTLDHSQ